MRIKPVLVGLVALGFLSACADVSNTSKGALSFSDSAPRSRTDQAIIIGKDEVIRVSALTPAEYRQNLLRTAHRFDRDTQGTVYFSRRSARLDASARSALTEQAKWIASNRQVRVSVIGHADEFSDSRDNHELGLERARAVVTYLVKSGVNQERLIALTSEGDLSQLTAEDENARLNRRVQTIVTELIEIDDDEDLLADVGSGPSRPGTGSGGGGSGGGGGGGGGSSGGKDS